MLGRLGSINIMPRIFTLLKDPGRYFYPRGTVLPFGLISPGFEYPFNSVLLSGLIQPSFSLADLDGLNRAPFGPV